MLFNILADIAKLNLSIVGVYALLSAYARRRRAQWTEHLTKRRLAVLGVLTLGQGNKEGSSVEFRNIDKNLRVPFEPHQPPLL